MNFKDKKKKIAYISGARADFGLMIPVLKAINKSKKLELRLYATGIHLMPEFGETIYEVKKEFSKAAVINAVFETDDRLGMAKFSGNFLQKVVRAFQENRPDFVLTLGDRPEMLCVATACLYLGIPTAQIHGGEKTFTVDEWARHAITKLSSVHFAATRESAERIKKMGEEKWRINVVGAPRLDTILNEKLPSRRELFSKLRLNPAKKIILIIYHPVSEEWEQSGRQMEEILAAAGTFNFPMAIIYPQADAGGRKIINAINKQKDNALFHIFPSLNHKDFLALVKESSVWVGNSSGAMIESSSFKIPVVNVGIRQRGREHGNNVLNVDCDRKEIAEAIKKSLYNKNYIEKLKKIDNPWGDGKASERIVRILENLELNKKLLVKQIIY